jgi:hypothetical protein
MIIRNIILFYLCQVRRRAGTNQPCRPEDEKAEGAEQSISEPKETPESVTPEFVLDNSINIEKVINTAYLPTYHGPTLAEAMTSPDKLPTYEVGRELRIAQNQLRRLTAENIFMKRSLRSVRDNYSTLTHNLHAIDPNRRRFRFRDDLRNHDVDTCM